MLQLFKKFVEKHRRPTSEQRLNTRIATALGITPRNIGLYQQALVHRSMLATDGHQEHNERLEFLGDSVLNLAVTHYLYTCFPNRPEGQLTKLRSAIVSRNSLNTIAIKLGIDGMLLTHNLKGNAGHQNIYGNALEALLGAIYLDQGFDIARRTVVEVLMERHIDLETIEQQAADGKSLLIELCQKRRIAFEFVTEAARGAHPPEAAFVSELHIGHRPVSKGHGPSKKDAEQQAALRGLAHLHHNPIPR
ncbi:MAG: ribonuclease III [Bacteroidales bacterium]|nr:ribonuclease III [Bacteroidales bacterium]